MIVLARASEGLDSSERPKQRHVSSEPEECPASRRATSTRTSRVFTRQELHWTFKRVSLNFVHMGHLETSDVLAPAPSADLILLPMRAAPPSSSRARGVPLGSECCGDEGGTKKGVY